MPEEIPKESILEVKNEMINNLNTSKKRYISAYGFSFKTVPLPAKNDKPTQRLQAD